MVNRLDYALTVARLSILDTLAGPEPETPPTQSLENVGLARIRFALDSPLEGTRIELLVPPREPRNGIWR